MLLECQHCGYMWNYNGENRFYATCPQCRYKVKLSEAISSTSRSINPTRVRATSDLKGVGKIIRRVISGFEFDKRSLIQILLTIQHNYGWLPQEMLLEVSKQLEVPYGQIYQIATFYKAFSTTPRGRHHIRVCNGTSCNVRGSQAVIEGLERRLGIGATETTIDGRFSLETVNCVGCCAMGPMVAIDGEYFGKMEVKGLDNILEKYK